jgi:hypothetical protein
MRGATHRRRGKLHGGRGKAVRTPGTSANLGFEAQLWAAANALRGSMAAAEVLARSFGDLQVSGDCCLRTIVR